MNPKTRFIESVKVLRLKPGDIIVAALTHPMNLRDAPGVAEQLEGAFPGHKVIVTQNGITISTARHEEPADGHAADWPNRLSDWHEDKPL